jgi:sterol desaturase/sphingolipid hydroxylase (fatty acid hydroxylase superfamily)
METQTLISRVLPVLIALALASVIEALIPLRNQPRQSNGRLATNLWLLAITLSLAMLLNFILALGAAYVQQSGGGLLQLLGLGTASSFLVALLALDGTTYLVHRLMHRIPILWRVHLVHHTDASVDATTAFRQHPVEGVLRFSFIAATAWILGASPEVLAIYRLLGTLNAVLEHANIRVPRALDRALVWFWVTPDMHKVHHSRERVETDSNYANLFSVFDRLFRTFTPSSRGPLVRYGIAGHDAPEHQSIGAVLRLPFRPTATALAAFVAVLVLVYDDPSAAEPQPEQVVFVCEHGTVKSVMAASYFNQLATQRGLKWRAVSRGSAEDATAKIVAADVADAVRIVAIGADLPAGIQVEEQRIERWDDVPPASTNPAAAQRSLAAHVADLLDRLSRQPADR